MNFAELTTELYARGTDYLAEDAAGVARAQRWINQAYRQVTNLHSWRFLESQATGDPGAGTVLVPKLRKVRFVRDLDNDNGRVLQRISLPDLVADGEDPTLTGTPQVYYVDQGNIIRTWPSGGTIQVDYITRVDPLTGTDEPFFDEEYHDIIVDLAMIKAYKDSDNFEAAAALREEVNLTLSAMAEDYLLDSREVQFIEPSGTDF